jgi:hypothetical protein
MRWILGEGGKKSCTLYMPCTAGLAGSHREWKPLDDVRVGIFATLSDIGLQMSDVSRPHNKEIRQQRSTPENLKWHARGISFVACGAMPATEALIVGLNFPAVINNRITLNSAMPKNEMFEVRLLKNPNSFVLGL